MEKSSGHNMRGPSPCLRPLTQTSSRVERAAAEDCSSEYTPTTTSINQLLKQSNNK